jgi:hypothetical protein
MNIRYAILLTTFFYISLSSVAQYYDSGQDPASVKWMQIKSGHFRIIYPDSYGEQGIAFARALNNASARLTELFPEKKFVIPVIIHSLTTQSNGYVSWAPRRMELYPTPEQNTIPLDFHTQLAVHELTHVMQLQSLRTGFTKSMSVVFGEQFTGVVSALLPLWFLEGDAVYAETALTSSGRGRSPLFQMQLKAMITEDNFFGYEKMLLGSFRDFIPDHYRTGYQMVAWSYLNYDHNIWNRMLSFTGKYPFTVVPNNISLLSSANLTRKKLFNETFAGLDKIWNEDAARSTYDSFKEISPAKKREYINYYSPVVAGKDSVISVKTSLSRTARFVLINPSQRTEKKIYMPGYVYPWLISGARGKVVWVENYPDPRWDNRNYSVIKILDIRTGISRKLTSGSRYMASAISPDASTIAATENTIANRNNLVLIDPDDGSVVKSIPAPGNVSLQHPQWSSDGHTITFISLGGRGEGIISYDTRNNGWRTLLKESNNDLQSSFLRNDSLFFISSLSGTDNLYLLTPGKDAIPLTNSKLGISDLHISGDIAFFSDYSSKGNAITAISLKEAAARNLSMPDSSSFLISRIMDKHPEQRQVSPGEIPELTPEPYRKWNHLLNFHSWMPFYADIRHIQADPLAIRPGLAIMSQNQLSTLITSLGYEYSADHRHVFHSRVTWQGWYPVIESELDYGQEPLITNSGAAIADPNIPTQGVRFRNTLSLPLSFTTGRFMQFISPYLTADYRNRYIYVRNSNFRDYGQTQLSARLYFSNVARSSHRDFYPKWAQIIDLNYNFSPWDEKIYGRSKSVKTAFFVPGVLRNNSIRFRFEKEIQKWKLFYTGNNIRWPRGYKNIISGDLTYLSAEYSLPLLYPDLNIPPLLYIKRIRGSVFHDYARGKNNAHFRPGGLDHTTPGYETFRSYGFELLTDFHALRNPFMISAGISGSWPDIPGAPVFEFVFNIDVFGMTIGRSGL